MSRHPRNRRFRDQLKALFAPMLSRRHTRGQHRGRQFRHWTGQQFEDRLMLSNVPPIADAGGPYEHFVGTDLELE